MALVSGAVLLCGFAPSYAYFLVLMPLAGIGNSVFHPADFAILNASVKESWLGRAYGVHTLGGNLGWAASPLIVLGLASFFGWRSALVVAGLIGFAVLALLMTQASQLDDGLAERRERRKTHAPMELRAILLSPAIVLCFVYFVLLAIFMVGVQNFLPTILIVDGFTLSLGTSALTAFLFASSGGTILGAILADRTAHHDWIVAAGLLVAGAAVAAVGYIGTAGPDRRGARGLRLRSRDDVALARPAGAERDAAGRHRTRLRLRLFGARRRCGDRAGDDRRPPRSRRDAMGAVARRDLALSRDRHDDRDRPVQPESRVRTIRGAGRRRRRSLRNRSR